MKHNNIVNSITLVFAVSILLMSPVISAKNQSELYDQYIAKHLRAKHVKFRDDPTDVGGKAYDFAKASLSWLGVPSTFTDSMDFVKSASEEGVNSGNVLSLATKLVGNNIDIKIVSKQVKGMSVDEIKFILMKNNIFNPKNLDIQGQLLAFLSETAPQAGGKLAGNVQVSEVFTDVMVDIVNNACKTCNVAHKAYKLAQEAANATDQAFDNTKTQRMFNQMDIAGFYKFKDFDQYYTGGEQLKSGARKALDLYHKSQGLGPPTEEDVKRFIYKRYERWQKEIETHKKEAKILEEMKPEFLKLPDRHKKAFISEFLSVYNDLLKYKGNGILITGSNFDQKIRMKALYLLKNKHKSWFNYEYHKALAIHHLGWGKKPSKPRQPSKAEESKKLGAVNKEKLDIVMTQVTKINHNKFLDTLEELNVKSQEPYLDCLCRNAGYGSSSTRQFYHPDTLGKFDERYACQQPGEPCVVAGYGCLRHPLPTEQSVIDSCMKANKIGITKDENGKIDPESGVRLDELIMDKLQKRK